MVVRVLYVSVAQSFDPRFSLAELEPWVERAWAISVAKASACDRVVATALNFLDLRPLSGDLTALS